MPSGCGIPEITGVLFFQNAWWDLMCCNHSSNYTKNFFGGFYVFGKDLGIKFFKIPTLHGEKIMNSKAPSSILKNFKQLFTKP
jgi:hypothetical protein